MKTTTDSNKQLLFVLGSNVINLMGKKNTLKWVHTLIKKYY